MNGTQDNSNVNDIMSLFDQQDPASKDRFVKGLLTSLPQDQRAHLLKRMRHNQDITFEDTCSKKIKDLESQVISGFYEDEVPQFRQGYPAHELESVVTAEEVTRYVTIITNLTNLVRELKGTQ